MQRVFVVLVVLVIGIVVPAAADPPAVVVPFVTIAAGKMSGIQQPLQAAIRDRAAWAALWRRHAGAGAAAPAVDFTREMVLAIFGGAAPVPRVVTIGNIVSDGGVLKVWYTVRETLPLPDPEGFPPTAPFHIVRMARSSLPVVFTQTKMFPPVKQP